MSSLKKQGLPVRGLLFGEGPLADELQARIDQEQLNVTLAGYVEQVADAYRSLDVLVSCSHNEGLPLNLIEAMALGVPVVTMATGGCREIVEEGVTGLVVPQGDQVALNRALLSLVGDETQRRQFGQAALRVAEKRFSLEAWAQGAESVYAAVQRQPRDG
jgi:glycosyltransferase involved in cell wall biosynthesis